MTRYGWLFDSALVVWVGGMLVLCGLCVYGIFSTGEK